MNKPPRQNAHRLKTYGVINFTYGIRDLNSCSKVVGVRKNLERICGSNLSVTKI